MSNLAVKKILPSTPLDGRHSSTQLPYAFFLTWYIVYGTTGDADGEVEYIACAPRGSSTAQPKWHVRKITYSSDGPTNIESASEDFDQVAANYLTLSYS